MGKTDHLGKSEKEGVTLGNRAIRISGFFCWIFARLIEEGSSTIHYMLLEHPDVNKERMLILAERAAGKKIRNIAKQKAFKL